MNYQTKRPHYCAVILDLDGVLCHTDRFHYQAWKQVADRLCIPFDESVNHRLRGVSRMQSLDIILEKAKTVFSPEEKLVLAQEKNVLYRTLLEQMSTADLSDEVRDTLVALRRGGLRLAIGSSSKNTPLILDKLGLTGFFEAVSDGNTITHSKPDPEVFLTAAAMLELPPVDCLVVEDAVAGLEAARAAGMEAAAIGDAVSSPLALYKLESFAQLGELLLDTHTH